MIVKELDPFIGSEPFEWAGRRAEEQMAFYLRRALGSIENVYVFNGLRFEVDGLFTQIDHLVVHPCGFVAVESKSVTTEVRINEAHEWSRLVDGKWKGMASPLRQAEAQMGQLGSLLEQHATELQGKFLGLVQGRFGGYTYEQVVAISDTGIVERPSPTSYPNVLKADMVTRHIWDHIAGLQKKANIANPLNLGSWSMKFRDKDLARIVAFLKSVHQPRGGNESTASTIAVTPEAATDNPASQRTPPAERATPAAAPAPAQDESASASRRYFCATCQRSVSLSVARFCWGNRPRFHGKVYCLECQKARS